MKTEDNLMPEEEFLRRNKVKNHTHTRTLTKKQKPGAICGQLVPSSGVH